MKADIERVIGRAAQGDVIVRNLVDVYYHEVGLEALAAHVTRPFEGLKVAAYYGCLLTRPPKVTLADDPEYPTHMEDVLKTLGCAPSTGAARRTAAAPAWRCASRAWSSTWCRRSSPTPRLRRRGRRLRLPALPGQPRHAGKTTSRPRDPGWQPLPVLFLSQVVGRAIGVEQATLGLKKHMVPVGRAMA